MTYLKPLLTADLDFALWTRHRSCCTQVMAVLECSLGLEAA